MNVYFIHGWNYFHREIVEKAEEFIHSWRATEDNATYSNAMFYGAIYGKSEKFEEITEGEENLLKDLRYLIFCHLVRSGKEVYITLLRY